MRQPFSQRTNFYFVYFVGQYLSKLLYLFLDGKLYEATFEAIYIKSDPLKPNPPTFLR